MRHPILILGRHSFRVVSAVDHVLLLDFYPDLSCG